MKLCIDCAEEIPEDRLRLAQGTMRCVSCQEIHDIGWYEKQIRQSELKSKNLVNSKEKNHVQNQLKAKSNFIHVSAVITKRINLLIDHAPGVVNLDKY